MQAKDDRQNIGQVHRQDAPHNRMKYRLQSHQQNDATHIRQQDKPYDTTRRRTPREHHHNNEAAAIHCYLDHGMVQTYQPRSIPHGDTKHNRIPPIPTTTSTW